MKINEYECKWQRHSGYAEGVSGERIQNADDEVSGTGLLAYTPIGSHDDAQDASQETFVRIYRSFNQYRGDCSLRSWIYRIATNEALRLISKRKQEEVSLESDSTGVSLIPADNYIDFDDKVAVKLQKAILSLPPTQQLAFNMRYYDELGFDEIAKVADSTPASIKASYHVAKEKIIKYMNSND